jgi:ferredoxin
MLGEYVLKRLAGINLPALSERKCLNQRGQKKTCYLCRDHCPPGAITHKGGKVVLDEDLCDGCSLCMAVCPSSAFVSEKLDYREALDRMHGKNICLLTCRESRIETPTIIVPCLGGIPWEAIAALALQKEGRTIFLNISNCWCCQRNRSLWILFRNVKKARMFVEKSGAAFSLQAIVGKTMSQPSTEAISRRDAIAFFAGKMKKETLTVLLPPSKGRGEQEYLRCLLQKVRIRPKSAVNTSGELPFKNWQVGTSCQACGVCQGVCPQQAWQLTRDEARVRLLYDAWKCTSCGLCHHLCPHQALLNAPWDALPVGGGVEKKHFPLQPCKSCRSSTVLQEDGFCLSCSRKEGMKAGLIAASHPQGN